MAFDNNDTLFGGNNPNTAQKNDTQVLEAWNPLEILTAGDLNGFIQWVQTFVRMVNNEIANALHAFDITPNGSLMNQLATLLQAQDAKIQAAATSGSLIGSYWFGLTGSVPGFVVPNPTSTGQNYYDFTTNTPYTAKSDLSGWTAGTVVVPPADADARIAITGKFWDIQQTNNQGGFAFWSYQSASWVGFAPTVVDFNNVALTGIPTAPTLTSSSPANQIVNKQSLTDAANDNTYSGVITLAQLVAGENTVNVDPTQAQIYRIPVPDSDITATIKVNFANPTDANARTFEIHLIVGQNIPTITWTSNATAIFGRDGGIEAPSDASSTLVYVWRVQNNTAYVNFGGAFRAI